MAEQFVRFARGNGGSPLFIQNGKIRRLSHLRINSGRHCIKAMDLPIYVFVLSKAAVLNIENIISTKLQPCLLIEILCLKPQTELVTFFVHFMLESCNKSDWFSSVRTEQSKPVATRLSRDYN